MGVVKNPFDIIWILCTLSLIESTPMSATEKGLREIMRCEYWSEFAFWEFPTFWRGWSSYKGEMKVAGFFFLTNFLRGWGSLSIDR